MKTFLVIVLAAATLQITAQQPRQEGPKDHERMMNLSAEEMANLQTKKMTLRLDLNDKQQKEIYAMNLENAKVRKAHMAARKAQRESGNAERPSQEQRVEMMNAMLDHKIEMKEKMKTILNEEQFAKWEKAQAKMEHKKRSGLKGKVEKRGERMKKE